jgi:4-hydroxy-2-oxoheptanedioate aldolase
MTGKQLLDSLDSGNRIYGTAIVSPSPLWPAAVKKTGIDFVFLDTEHMPLGRETLSWMCQTYKANDLPAIVRIPSPDPYQACIVLDGGAVGVLAPYVETVEQVKSLVGATKLRPLKGNKLNTALQSGELKSELRDYIEDRNTDNLLFINVESMPAVENLDKLLAVPGLDGIIIGPHDLSCSMDLPEEYSSTGFADVVSEIIDKVRKAGKPVGIHFSEEPEIQIHWARKGVNIILQSSDISLFGKALNNDISRIKNVLGDSEVTEYKSEII